MEAIVTGALAEGFAAATAGRRGHDFPVSFSVD